MKRQGKDGLLRGVYHRARLCATRWLAMTLLVAETSLAMTAFVKSNIVCR
jgi:hypothetical protein